jgi:hypothetical protein
MNSFLHGRKSVSAGALPPPAAAGPARSATRATASGPRAAAAADAPSEAQVEVVKEGDKVVRLVITCACGERVEVECLYPAGR